MNNLDIIVSSRKSKLEVFCAQPHINIRKVRETKEYINLEIEPAGDMGADRQRLHRMKLSKRFVAQFASLEWAARYAMLEAVNSSVNCPLAAHK